ncbi:MAG TPA: hypothetical protein VD866_26105 [Urbifossiella sp.]|nr:hypothetical protein [Urbifossiella sp.]
MFLTVHSKSWFDQTEWSVGYCPNCRRTEAIRIGHVISTTALYVVIRVRRKVGEQLDCCDNCGAEIDQYRDALVLDVADWSYRDGLPRLIEMCVPNRAPEPPIFTIKDEIQGFLAAVTRATRYTRVDLNNQWFIPLLGATLGASTCVIPVLLNDTDEGFRAAVLTLVVNAVIGGLVGVLVGGFRLCERNARRAIESAALKYQIPRDLLAEVAAEFPGRIRRAVARVV